jgi:hypothetical protein
MQARAHRQADAGTAPGRHRRIQADAQTQATPYSPARGRRHIRLKNERVGERERGRERGGEREGERDREKETREKERKRRERESERGREGGREGGRESRKQASLTARGADIGARRAAGRPAGPADTPVAIPTYAQQVSCTFIPRECGLVRRGHRGSLRRLRRTGREGGVA